MKPLSVILADDHPLIMDAIKSLLEPEFEIVGMFTDGQNLLEAAPTLNPNVIVLDIGIPTVNGLCAGERLKKLMPRVKLVYLTQNADQDTAKEAFRFGASAYVVKTTAASELVGAIREVARGGFYISPLVTKGIVGPVMQNFKSGKRKSRLTLRQKEVLQLLAEGHSMKGAAFILNVSHRTVAYHKYTMMDHLGIGSSAELIEYALNHSLVAV
jgi:DNA-binding NarL/FixJ family response regulator